jgi:hypothetical protein
MTVRGMMEGNEGERNDGRVIKGRRTMEGE